MTTATAALLSETGRSHLQESLFSWREPETAPKPIVAPAETPEPEQKTTAARRHRDRRSTVRLRTKVTKGAGPRTAAWPWSSNSPSPPNSGGGP